jgi:plasmid stabilization system protein ParE
VPTDERSPYSEALLEANRKKTWWHKNRPAAPDLFDEEMSAVVERIRSSPTIGKEYPAAFRVPVRRVLLPKTENHVFYAVRDGEVIILSVWGARKRRGPKL